jgi:hypothetical protein
MEISETPENMITFTQSNKAFFNIVIKLSTSYWSDAKGFYTKKEFRCLRRKSSPESIDYFLMDMNECGIDRFCKQLKLDNYKDGLYHVYMINMSRDWETGYVDDYDYELREYNENSDNFIK